MRTETIKVKPWGKDQGDYVEIDPDTFDPKIHTRIDDDKPVRRVSKRSD